MGLLDHKTAVITGGTPVSGWRPRGDLLPREPTPCSSPADDNPN